MLPHNISITQMKTGEIDHLSRLAMAEGWNPGISDVKIASEFDPTAFLALRSDHGMIGGGSILSYGRQHGFMGLFIVEKEYRGQGLGRQLWNFRKNALLEKLDAGSSIGMDGVLDLVPFYEEGGFQLAWKDIRFEGIAQGISDENVNDEVPDVLALSLLDEEFFPVRRTEFLKMWINAHGVHTASTYEGRELTGFAMTRPCAKGHKVGPFFARDQEIATSILSHLLSKIVGQFVQIDVPDSNVDGIQLARKFELRESFACARMYFGTPPAIDTTQLFGITSFEFG